MTDETITHQIVDRPNVEKQYINRSGSGRLSPLKLCLHFKMSYWKSCRIHLSVLLDTTSSPSGCLIASMPKSFCLWKTTSWVLLCPPTCLPLLRRKRETMYPQKSWRSWLCNGENTLVQTNPYHPFIIGVTCAHHGHTPAPIGDCCSDYRLLSNSFWQTECGFQRQVSEVTITFSLNSSPGSGRGGWRRGGGGRWGGRWWQWRGRRRGRRGGRWKKSSEDGKAKITGQGKRSEHLSSPLLSPPLFLITSSGHFSLCKSKWRQEKWNLKTRRVESRRKKQRKNDWPSWWWRRKRSISTIKSCSERKERSERLVPVLYWFECGFVQIRLFSYGFCIFNIGFILLSVRYIIRGW